MHRLRSLSVQKPNPLSSTTSVVSPQDARKLLHHPLRYKGVSPVGWNPRRSFGQVKASVEWEKGYKKVEVFSKEHLAVSLAYDVAELSNKFTKERGAFTVALSGGSLIKYLRKLVEPPYLDSIDWSKWHVFWVDERVVAKDHLDSNYKLANDGFLSKVPIPANNIYAIDDALPADGAADVYETNLRRLGPDGHVASLFPRHYVLKEKQKWVTFIKDSPKPPPERITFTLPVINSSSNVAMVVTGAGKADVIYTAMEKNDQSSDKLPLQLLSPEGELKWYLDKGDGDSSHKKRWAIAHALLCSVKSPPRHARFVLPRNLQSPTTAASHFSRQLSQKFQFHHRPLEL
ncbi:hypothetical protein L6164_016372 [Bauhinia variegata]|uniref:Uncharacterized protein n=1 Tax=Bauhinia variegata TaxID=167791 RepID=A0ACB9NP82_BAUVA|nr:hypothetical protein L6164_016372 [Bauhinia variegata]